tara:strand:+ start:427 stop:834 length:408 start_codon:yes stop_codon:yes gene_type:complete
VDIKMKNELRVLVCGGRDYSNVERLYKVLDWVDGSWESAESTGPISTIISGHARGADQLAEKYANEKNIPLEIYPAQWDVHGKSAGVIRNQEMLDEGLPDLVVAFPGGKGTAHMVKIAQKANVMMLQVTTSGIVV